MSNLIQCPHCDYQAEVESFDVVTCTPLLHEILKVEPPLVLFERRARTDSPDESTAKFHCHECDGDFQVAGWTLESW